MKVGASTLVAVAALVPVSLAIFQPVKVLPRIALAPGFQLFDQHGRRVTSDDLRGLIVLYSFAYSGCGAACAQQFSAMREVQERLKDTDTGEIPVRLVTILFDAPATGGPVPRMVAQELRARSEIWTVATADSASLRTVVGTGFNVYYGALEDGSYDFEPVFVLVDQLGVKRAVIRYGVPEADRVLRDLQDLATEAQAEGMAHLAYQAAHFFSCYSTPY